MWSTCEELSHFWDVNMRCSLKDFDHVTPSSFCNSILADSALLTDPDKISVRLTGPA